MFQNALQPLTLNRGAQSIRELWLTAHIQVYFYI